MVEIDDISKLKAALNRCLGTCHNALQYKNMPLLFKTKKFLFFIISWKMSFLNFDKNAIFFKFVNVSFLCVRDSVEIINAKTRLKYWFVKADCLNVIILHFSGKYTHECTCMLRFFVKVRVHTHTNVKE